MEKVKITPNIKRMIRKWLAQPRAARKKRCPFLQLTSYHPCRVCATIFPSLLNKEPGWGLNTTDCPCTVLSYDYVVRKAKKVVKGEIK